MFLSKLSKFVLGGSSCWLSSMLTSCNSLDNSGQYDEIVSFKQFRANQQMQDRICIAKLQKFKGIAVGVFDGHGSSYCADFLAGNLKKYLNERIKKNFKKGTIKKIMEASLTECFDDLQNGWKVIFQQNIDDIGYSMSGSCALVAILTPMSVIIGNVGDCEGGFFGKQKITRTNRRLNAGEQFQQQRLLKQYPDQQDIITCIKNTKYCYIKGLLQPTRSFGDFYLKDFNYNFKNLQLFDKSYITHQPQIKFISINMLLGNKLVLGTDGLWDQLSFEEVNKIVIENNGKEEIQDVLLKEALKKVMERNRIKSMQKLEEIRYRRKLHDDISIVVVDIQKFQKHFQKNFWLFR